jgi:hypothetical protein
VSAALSGAELAVVSDLVKSGLSRPAAVLAVVMAVREHARPRPELIDIVRQYPNLEDRDVAGEALHSLERTNWIVESTSYGIVLVHQAGDLRQKIAGAIGRHEIAEELLSMRSRHDRYIQIVGPMNDQQVYETFLRRLEGAQREICLPMLATTPYLSAVPIIQDRAKHGVRVRILLGSERVVAKVRGETARSIASESIAGWRKNAKGFETMEVRISNSVEDMQTATCMTVDAQFLRFDLYDPRTQRSLEGILIEVESPRGMELNLMSVFKRQFEDAWRRARPTSLGVVGWALRQGWQWWCAIGFGVASLFFELGSRSSDLCIGLAGAFLFNAVVASWPPIWARVRRLFA